MGRGDDVREPLANTTPPVTAAIVLDAHAVGSIAGGCVSSRSDTLADALSRALTVALLLWRGVTLRAAVTVPPELAEDVADAEPQAVGDADAQLVKNSDADAVAEGVVVGAADSVMTGLVPNVIVFMAVAEAVTTALRDAWLDVVGTEELVAERVSSDVLDDDADAETLFDDDADAVEEVHTDAEAQAERELMAVRVAVDEMERRDVEVEVRVGNDGAAVSETTGESDETAVTVAEYVEDTV